MYKEYPLDPLPQQLQRPELQQIREQGFDWSTPQDVIDEFERKVAKFAGADHGVAVDCCSHGLFLCLKYLKAQGTVTIPDQTYISVAHQIELAGCQVALENRAWTARYRLDPWPIWDAATEWAPDMFQEDFFVISFQFKKRIAIGRGGMILTNDGDAAAWLRRARYDGRDPNTLQIHDNIDMLGYHYYMTPEDAARGIMIMNQVGDQAWHSDYTAYRPISSHPVYADRRTS